MRSEEGDECGCDDRRRMAVAHSAALLLNSIGSKQRRSDIRNRQSRCEAPTQAGSGRLARWQPGRREKQPASHVGRQEAGIDRRGTGTVLASSVLTPNCEFHHTKQHALHAHALCACTFRVPENDPLGKSSTAAGHASARPAARQTQALSMPASQQPLQCTEAPLKLGRTHNACRLYFLSKVAQPTISLLSIKQFHC